MKGVAIAKKQKGLKRNPFFAKLRKAKTREEKRRLVRQEFEKMKMQDTD